jgi:hypothetical protein
MTNEKVTRTVTDSAGQSAGRAGETVSEPASEPDDGQLAALLVRMWSLASGRTVRTDVPPDQLTEEELISFWADDFTRPRGRHAAGTPEAAPCCAARSTGTAAPAGKADQVLQGVSAGH